MSTRISIRAAVFVLISLCAARTSSASIVFYTDQAAFETAAGSTASFGFNELASGGQSVSFASAAGLSIDGFTLVGTTANPNSPFYLGAVGPDFFASDYNHVPGASSVQGPAVSSSFYGINSGVLTITTPQTGVTAFGLQLFDVLTGTTDGSGSDTVRLSAGASTGSVVTPPFTGAAFIGFISTSPVTSVTLQGTTPEEFPTVTQVEFSPSSVPEPATFGSVALACLAALTLPSFRRWRLRAS